MVFRGQQGVGPPALACLHMLPQPLVDTKSSSYLPHLSHFGRPTKRFWEVHKAFWAPRAPRAPQRHTKKWGPKRAKWSSGDQMESKGNQMDPKGTKWSPESRQGKPKPFQRHQRKPRGQTIYSQTPDQPPKRPTSGLAPLPPTSFLHFVLCRIWDSR